jgi:CysZ protein
MDSFDARLLRPTSPGFAEGVAVLWRGVSFLWRTPRAWPFAMVPVSICALLSSVAFGLAVTFMPSLVAQRWPELADMIGLIWARLLGWVITLVAAFGGVVLASLITPPLCAPALEKLIRMREQDLGAPARATPSLLREFSCALKAQLLASAVIGPILAALWLTTFLAPPAAVVTVPLKFIAVSWLLAWTLLDYPMSLRGVSVRDRLRMLRRGARAVFSFGAALAVLFAIPFATLLLLPIAVTAAAELSARLEPSA